MSDGERARVEVSARVGAALVVFASAATLVRAAVTALWDADVWWILRAGQLILGERVVPHENRFSFTAPHAPWVMHEWLFGVVYAAAHRVGGFGALALVRLGFAAVSCASLVWTLGREAPLGVAGVLSLVGLAGFSERFESPRPVGMSAAFALASVAILFAPRVGRRHALAFAAVMLAWTNAHGSFPLGIAVAVAALGEPGGRRARAEAVALGALATLVNPYGLAMHGLVGRYLTGGGGDAVALVHARILEWWPLLRAPLRVASVAQLAGLLGLTAFWCDAARNPRWRWRFALMIALLAMTLRHSRHLELFGLIATALAAGPLTERLKLPPEGSSPWRAARWVLPALAVALGLWAAAARGRSAGQWADPSGDDEAMARRARALPEGARVFAPLAYTGWVIFQGFPRVRVLYDTRNDCYPYAVLRDGFDLSDGRLAPERAAAALAGVGATHALAMCDSAAARGLARWRLTARDGAVCVFEP